LENLELPAETVRNILGAEAIIGLSAPRLQGAATVYDYVEFASFDSVSALKNVPAYTAVGYILEPASARKALQSGANGITVDCAVFLSRNPEDALASIAEAGRCSPRPDVRTPWRNEFGLIENILKQAIGTESGLIVPPGDDACLLASLDCPVISTDTQKEGVHFRLDWQSPEEIGEKAVSITLSDLAASYASPVSLFVNLSVPPRISDAFVEELYRGIGAGLERYGCSLGGGNISGGRELSLDLFAVGRGRKDLFPKRSNAKAGFGLYVTGPLGLARAGLEAMRKNDRGFPDLVERFKNPRARFDAAEVLAAREITCVMDISDGLSGDAAHIAEASGITIELDAGSMPHPESLISFCRKYDQDPNDFALAGGEDYELLFACPQEVFSVLKQSLPEAAPVGRCHPLQDRYILSRDIPLSSYRHGF
jgi:thiamine-monophosphate kinase